MKEVKYWIAEDGTKFEDKQECEQYERQMILKEYENDFVFYDFFLPKTNSNRTSKT